MYVWYARGCWRQYELLHHNRRVRILLLEALVCTGIIVVSRHNLVVE